MSWIRQTRVAGGRGPLGYRPANKEDSRGLAKLLHASTDKEQELKALEEKIVNFYWKKNRGCACVKRREKRCFLCILLPHFKIKLFSFNEHFSSTFKKGSLLL